MKIGLIGDYQESITAHRAIPKALQLAANTLSISADYHWIHSSELDDHSLDHFTALWCVPGSPYEQTDNVLKAINHARTSNVPFLGTCGGYQHAALEFVRNELNYPEADNTEINPDTTMPLISGLVCKLYDQTGTIDLLEDSQISTIYGKTSVSEEYFCGYGVNSNYLNLFNDSDMNFSGFDEDGDPRALEITNHRFFIGTAFQPERSAFNGSSHPLVVAFLSAARKS